MKTKVLLAAVAVAFSFAVTSCGNKKAADSNATEADSCCAAKTEQVCDSAKACCQAADSVACPKAVIQNFTYILLCGIIILLAKFSGSECCA